MWNSKAIPVSYIDAWHEVLHHINRGETTIFVSVPGPKSESEKILRRYASNLLIPAKVSVQYNIAKIELAHPKLDMKEKAKARRLGLIK